MLTDKKKTEKNQPKPGMQQGVTCTACRQMIDLYTGCKHPSQGQEVSGAADHNHDWLDQLKQTKSADMSATALTASDKPTLFVTN